MKKFSTTLGLMQSWSTEWPMEHWRVWKSHKLFIFNLFFLILDSFLEIKMATFNVQCRVKQIEPFYSSERLIVKNQRKYRQHFNAGVSVHNKMIRNLFTRFERTGSVGDLPVRGPMHTGHTDTAVEVVRQSVRQLLSVVTLLTRTSLQKILKPDLNTYY